MQCRGGVGVLLEAKVVKLESVVVKIGSVFRGLWECFSANP